MRGMTPKAGPLLDARIVRERAWAYQAWMSRVSWGAMRALANLPESEGGLGYDLSESALKGLVDQAKADRGDLTMSREQRIERQSAELDERARLARQDYDAAYTRRRKLDAAIESFSEHLYSADDVNALARLIEQRDRLARELEAADRRLDSVHDREGKLHGLNAATEHKVEVVHRDAIIDELNAALEAAGRERVVER